MKIYRFINRVPGGMMVVPLFIGMLINTFFPDLLKIGGFTQALTGVGYPTVLGMYLFTVGTKITVTTAPKMLVRGLGIMTAKVGTATIFALAVAHLFDGSIIGLSTLAVMVAMSDTNGGMFLALTSVMGNKEDAGTYVVQSIETGPFLTMLIFVGTGLAVIPWLTMVSVIAPIVAGTILGNLDEDIKNFFGSHEPIIVPFMAFTLGQTINLKSVATAGIPGIVLGVTVVSVTGFVCIVADRLFGGTGIAGAAASSTAGNSAAVPQAVALADTSYAPIAGAATVQVAASVIVTAILTPLLTSWWYKRVTKEREVMAALSQNRNYDPLPTGGIMRKTLLVLLALAIAPDVALAQTPRDTHPDWTGFYTLATNRELAGAGLKQDFPGEELNNLIVPHLQPWAKARMEATDGIADDTGQVCLPDGIFRYPSMAGRFLWLQERGRIVMVFGLVNTAGVRRVYFDRQHPKNPAPSWNGHSVGRWEGDTVLVDTVGFNDKSWLFGGMEPHTEEAHLMERMRLVANGAFMEINITVEDRHALTSAYTYNRYYKRQPETAEMAENVCNEDPDTWKAFRNAALKRQMDRARQVK